ncbi:hypothetical protein ARMSODRAFT_976399 [Armillaria solidipes]|uniref:Uncharacterized protein n=1 Tax=Armillaria solidipes TaxID=1076256 RepID=A0A2H3BB89_9AGAR|nr:hypothetical protein ARMSODRAFT_976399 [Armillaria solidipes]
MAVSNSPFSNVSFKLAATANQKMNTSEAFMSILITTQRIAEAEDTGSSIDHPELAHSDSAPSSARVKLAMFLAIEDGVATRHQLDIHGLEDGFYILGCQIQDTLWEDVVVWAVPFPIAGKSSVLRTKEIKIGVSLGSIVPFYYQTKDRRRKELEARCLDLNLGSKLEEPRVLSLDLLSRRERIYHMGGRDELLKREEHPWIDSESANRRNKYTSFCFSLSTRPLSMIAYSVARNNQKWECAYSTLLRDSALNVLLNVLVVTFPRTLSLVGWTMRMQPLAWVVIEEGIMDLKEGSIDIRGTMKRGCSPAPQATMWPSYDWGW